MLESFPKGSQLFLSTITYDLGITRGASSSSTGGGGGGRIGATF